MTLRPGVVVVAAALASGGCSRCDAGVSADARPSRPIEIDDLASDSPESDDLPPCPRFSGARGLGVVANEGIDEASGLAGSRRNRGVLWVHNDSGDRARIFAMNEDGEHLGTYLFGDVEARDWEDMAVGPGPEPKQSYLYVGDIGDNQCVRESIAVHRIVEPEVGAGERGERQLDGVETFRFRYPLSEAHDAEVLLVDPRSADLFVLTKDGVTGRSGVFRADAPLSAAQVTTLELVRSIEFGEPPLPGNRYLTAGDVSADGRFILLRTYESAFLWRRPEGASLDQALGTDPCPEPVAVEPQGEAVAFDPFGLRYFTVSEHEGQPIYAFEAAP